MAPQETAPQETVILANKASRRLITKLVDKLDEELDSNAPTSKIVRNYAQAIEALVNANREV